MFFGGSTFAGAPFADPGFNPNALAVVTGNRINESTGTVSVVGKAIVLPNGSRFNIGIGNVQVADVVGVDGIATALSTGLVTIAAGANVTTTGNLFDLATGTVNVADVVGVTGNRVDLDTGDITIAADANISPTGSRINESTGTVTFQFRYRNCIYSCRS
jgi:hypothetical protein